MTSLNSRFSHFCECAYIFLTSEALYLSLNLKKISSLLTEKQSVSITKIIREILVRDITAYLWVRINEKHVKWNVRAKRRILQRHTSCYPHSLRSLMVFYSCPHLPTWLVTVNGVTAGRLYTPPSPDSGFLPLWFTSFWPLKKLWLANDLQQTPTLNSYKLLATDTVQEFLLQPNTNLRATVGQTFRDQFRLQRVLECTICCPHAKRA